MRSRYRVRPAWLGSILRGEEPLFFLVFGWGAGVVVNVYFASRGGRERESRVGGRRGEREGGVEIGKRARIDMFVKLKKMFLFYMGEGGERVRRQVERMQGCDRESLCRLLTSGARSSNNCVVITQIHFSFISVN